MTAEAWTAGGASRAGPLRRTQDALLVLWLALISADRIDLLGGAGPFVLTPFLVLTPLVVVSEGVRIHLRGSGFRVSRDARRYAVLCLALIIVVVVSAFFARDRDTSAMRTAHLALLVVATGVIAASLFDHPRVRSILVRGAKAALLIALLFSVAQVFAWIASDDTTLRLGFATVSLRASDYAGFVPRLSGPVADQNRAGLLYLFCLFVLFRWGRPGGARRGWTALAVLLLLATLSRSAALGALGMAVVGWVDRPDVRISRSTALVALAGVATVLAFLLLDPVGRAEALRTVEPLADRLSLEEGSARSHLALLGRGLEVGSSSLEHSAVGIGYGNAYLVLQDFFPGNPYGNFHSLYVTMYAEAGVLALLFTLLLLAYPLVRGGPFRPLVAAVVFLNLFYQFAADPLFWLIVALAWIGVGRTISTAQPPAPAETAARTLERRAG